MAELALNRTVNGRLPAVGKYPDPLSGAGARRWTVHADFSLTHARMRAARGDIVGTVGQVAKAIIETAHALACRRRLWVLNEKKLVERVGLDDLHAGFVDVPASPPQLVAWVERFHYAIDQARSLQCQASPGA